ncbi:MAG: prolipoprotein diacylglyceryl transferase [Oscillospiraceae bacterium]|nr:prolipoprotein diacylglyceryl transferase [Oscillospiraceae bacterium]
MFLSQIFVNPSSPILFPNLGIRVDPNQLVFPGVPVLGNIHWYGLIIGIGLVLAAIYGMKRAKQFGLTDDHILTMLLYAVPISIICARAYYCIFYWELFQDDPITCLYIWDGGIAIYGAIIGAVATVVVYCKVTKISVGAMMDIGALGLLIGQSIGRWGNFFNREAFGEVTDSFLKMGLYDWSGNLNYYHPTFFYESAWNAVGFILLHFYSKHRKFDGEVFSLYAAWYGIGRFFIEGLRTDSLYLFSTGIRVSQLVGIVSFVCALGFFLYMRLWKKPDGSKLYVNQNKSA